MIIIPALYLKFGEGAVRVHETAEYPSGEEVAPSMVAIDRRDRHDLLYQ